MLGKPTREGRKMHPHMLGEPLGPALIYTGYSVTFLSKDPVLKLLTPEFLHYNNIVPSEWRPEPPTLLSSEFREMRFTSGFVARLELEEMEFGISLENNPVDQVELCNWIVRRFLEVLPGLEINRFSAQLRGYMMMPENSPGILNIGAALEDVLPLVAYNGTYTLDNRDVYFDVREVNQGGGGVIDCLDFHYVTSFDVNDSPRSSVYHSIKSTLEDWQIWLGELDYLASEFYETHIS
jgi:hypothetical protein